MKNLTDIQKMAIETALKKVLADTNFSICRLRDCLELCGLSTDTEAYKTLSVLHCVDYSQMHPRLRNRIPELISQCFADGSSGEIAISKLNW